VNCSNLGLLDGETADLGNTGAILVIDLVEVLDHSLLDVHAAIFHSITNVSNDGLSLLIIEHLSEQSSGLLVVIVGVEVGISASLTGDSPFVVSVSFIFNGTVQ